MRYLRLKSGCFALLLLVIGAVAWAHSVRVIYLAQMDGTPPSTPLAPSTVTLLSTSGAMEVGFKSSFGGIRSFAAQTLAIDTDGAGAWTVISNPSPSFVTAMGFAVPTFNGGRMIVAGVDSVGGGCGVWYTDNNGASWTFTDFGADVDNCQPGSYGISQERVAACDGAGNCYITGEEGNVVAGCTGGLCNRVMRSTNNGSTWSSIFLSSNTGAQRNREGTVIYARGSEWIVAGMESSAGTCGGGFGNEYIFSDATTTAGFLTGVCWTFHDATKLGSTYYAIGYINNCVCPATIWTSTDRATWVNQGAPTLTPSLTNAGYLVVSSLQCYENYRNPTCYLVMGNTAASTFVVYTSTDMTNFTRIFTVASAGPGLHAGRIFQNTSDSLLPLYFGTVNSYFYSIT